MNDLEFKKLVADTKAEIAENKRLLAVYVTQKALCNFNEKLKEMGTCFQDAWEIISNLTKWDKFRVRLGFRIFLINRIFPEG
jgi:hypothetical protein